MNKLPVFLSLVLLTSSLSALRDDRGRRDREDDHLRERVAELEREKFARNMADGARVAGGYWTSLKKRWDKPENEEEYKKRLQAAQRYYDDTGDDSKLKEILAEGYKKGWFDRNPFKGDCVIVSGSLAAVVGGLAFIVWITSR